MQNIPNTTNTIQLQTALNISFNEKLLNSLLKTKQLQQQAKFRGIPISNHQKRFTTEEIRKLIYKYDNNITHMTDAEKEQYAKIDAMKKADAIKACKLQKIPGTKTTTPKTNESLDEETIYDDAPRETTVLQTNQKEDYRLRGPHNLDLKYMGIFHYTTDVTRILLPQYARNNTTQLKRWNVQNAKRKFPNPHKTKILF